MDEDSDESTTSHEEGSSGSASEGEEEQKPIKTPKLNIGEVSPGELSRMVFYMNDLIRSHLSGYITASEYQNFKTLIRPHCSDGRLQTLFTLLRECLSDTTDGQRKWQDEGAGLFNEVLQAMNE
jgi:hypothetical protein